jgi:hypothetical protein
MGIGFNVPAGKIESTCISKTTQFLSSNLIARKKDIKYLLIRYYVPSNTINYFIRIRG